ncbi:hypothetical protein FACS1894206_10140 [Deltaproteobacteria bacterium]|nr:hypothetical protein FACS1894206_10140 [Deltaproteobacteria bacterium]
MFSIGGGELLVILLVALIVFGPDKLPGLMRSFGNALGKWRKAADAWQRDLNTEHARESHEKRRKR